MLSLELVHGVGSHSGLCRHRSLEQKKDPLLTPGARASDISQQGRSKGTRVGRFQLRSPLRAWQGGGGDILGQCSLPDGVHGRPGAVGFSKSPAPTTRSSPGSAHIQVRTSLPSESTQDPVRPHWCLEKQRPEWWETVVCQK